MRLLATLSACAALGVAALTLPAGAAAAACAPASTTITDRPDDGKYLHPPEIVAVTAAVDEACTLQFTDEITNRYALDGYDWLYWWLDVDNNPATGRVSGPLAGVEYGLVVTALGQAQLLDRDGQVISRFAAAGPYAVAIAASAVGATETSTIRIVAYSVTAPAGQQVTPPPGYAGNYFDYAQSPGDPPFLLRLRPAGAEPAAPTPTPAPTPAPTISCVVPKLTGLTVAAARTRLVAAHCALGAVHRRRAKGKPGIVVSSAPTAGTTTTEGARVAVTVRARRR